MNPAQSLSESLNTESWTDRVELSERVQCFKADCNRRRYWRAAYVPLLIERNIEVAPHCRNFEFSFT